MSIRSEPLVGVARPPHPALSLSGWLDREAVFSWLMMALPLLFLAGLVGYPLVYGILLSLQDRAVAKPGHFVGLRNFIADFHDPIFWRVTVNTFVYTVAATLLKMVGGLGLALAMNQQFRMKNLVRALLLLPFIEQDNLQNAGYASYHEQHIPLYTCPSDTRATGSYEGSRGWGQQALTDYLAVTGTMTFVGDPSTGMPRPKCNGVMYESSRTRMADISDGTSNTVLVGERPPSPDLFWGWWTWSAFDASLGVRDTFAVYANSGTNPATVCGKMFPEQFRPNANNYCDTHHFWSAHPGGGNWLFADGSVRFLAYQSEPILAALATRCGGEVVSTPPKSHHTTGSPTGPPTATPPASARMTGRPAVKCSMIAARTAGFS